MLIKIKDLNKTYKTNSSLNGYIKVLNGISFDLEHNTVLGVIGESGSGKTTLAKILTKLETSDGGLIEIDGKNITSFNKKDSDIGSAGINSNRSLTCISCLLLLQCIWSSLI